MAEDLNDQEDVESSEKDQVIPLKTLGVSAEARDPVVVIDEPAVEVQPPTRTTEGSVGTDGEISELPSDESEEPQEEKTDEPRVVSASASMGGSGSMSGRATVVPGRRESIPVRERPFDVKGSKLYISLITDDAPLWHLPVNGLVIPVGVRAGFQGNLAKALQKLLGKSGRELRERVKSVAGREVDPYDPVHVSLDDPSLGPSLLPNAPEMPPGKGLTVDGRQVRYHVIAATAGNLQEVAQLEKVAEAVVRTAANNGVWRLACPTLGTGAGPFSDQGELAGAYMVRGVYNALLSLPEGAMGEITLTTRSQGTMDAMLIEANSLVNTVPQPLVSDEPESRDLLGIQTEVGALAEALLLEGVEPPLSVGILGGWGSGKSSVMNLMQLRMQEIRGYASPAWTADQKEWPVRTYVGHVYLIAFNAWTYAKSNLWASLMQTIFCELSRQLTLEKRLVEALVAVKQRGKEGSEEQGADNEQRRKELEAEAWTEANDIWPALYAVGDETRQLLLETEAGQDVLAEWQAGGIAAEELWDHLQKRSEEESAALDRLKQELAKARLALDEEIERVVVWAPTLSRLKAVLTKHAWEKLNSDLDKEDTDTLVELYRLTPDFLSVLEAAFRRPVQTLALLSFAFVIFITPWLLNLVSWRLPGMLVSAATVLAGWGRVAVRLQRTLDEVREEYMANLDAERESLRLGEGAFIESQRLKERREKVADLEARVQEQERRVGLTSRFRSLHEFVQSRLEERYYEEQLGLMHRVEGDLQELTEALYIGQKERPSVWLAQKRELFPRGQPRVVLYIDDLDRCPPDRVVEVLEAVQLLLKKKLFVVVLGLDTRYVTRALEKAYRGILVAEGEPSGLDYIEKILSVPYRVHKVSPEVVARFLQGQKMGVLSEEPAMGAEEEVEREEVVPSEEPEVTDGARALDRRQEPAQREALRPEAVTFSPLEYDTIQTTCRQIELTPRSLKRIANVMKLIKIFWHRAGISAERFEVQTVVALLALSAQYPEVMRDAFEELGGRRRLKETDPLTWHDFFQEFVSTHRARNLHLDARAEEFLDDVQAMMPERTKIIDVDAVHIRLTRSFSFVGDPTSAVEPATKVELVDRKKGSELS